MTGQKGISSISKNHFMTVMANIVFLLVLFPYITPIKTPVDIQPYALAVALLFFLSFLTQAKVTLPRPLFIIGLISIYAVANFFLYSMTFNGLRSLVGYVSIFIFAFVALKTYHLVNSRLFLYSIMIWLIAAMVELLGGSQLIRYILPDMRTGGIRGVTGLAPEPAHYARMIGFFLALNELFYQEKRYPRHAYLIFMATLFIQAILSYSGTALVVINTFLIAKIASGFISGRWFSLRLLTRALTTVVIITLVVTAFLKVDVLKTRRAGLLFAAFLENGVYILQADRSIRSRVSDILLPMYSLIYGYGMGFGTGTYNEHASELYWNAPRWIQEFALPGAGYATIKSGFGRSIYELGGIGLLLMAIVLYIVFRSVYRSAHTSPALLVSGFILLMFIIISVPIALPLVGYLLGIHLKYGYQRTRKSTNNK